MLPPVVVETTWVKSVNGPRCGQDKWAFEVRTTAEVQAAAETSDGFKLPSESCSFWSQRMASAFCFSPSFSLRRKQLQICFYARVGGFLLASLKASALSEKSFLRRSDLLFFPDFLPVPLLFFQTTPSRARSREQVSPSSLPASCTDRPPSLTAVKTSSGFRAFRCPARSRRKQKPSPK